MISLHIDLIVHYVDCFFLILICSYIYITVCCLRYATRPFMDGCVLMLNVAWYGYDWPSSFMMHDIWYVLIFQSELSRSFLYCLQF